MSLTKIRRNRSEGYASVCTHILRNKTVSCKARGVFMTIMSLPENWDFSIKGLIAIVPDGQHAIYSVMEELIDAGYVERSHLRELGKIVGVEYTFNEVPVENNLDTGNLDLENSRLENPSQLNSSRIYSSLNELKKEEPPLPPPLFIFKTHFPKQKLNAFQKQVILDKVDNEGLWRDTCELWALKGYKSRNVVGMLETYERGKEGTLTPPRPTPPTKPSQAVSNDGCPFCTAVPPMPCPKHKEVRV